MFHRKLDLDLNATIEYIDHRISYLQAYGETNMAFIFIDLNHHLPRKMWKVYKYITVNPFENNVDKSISENQSSS